MSLYHLSVTVHVLAAFLWLGGMFFLAAVGAPTLRTLEPQLRTRLFRELGIRFRTVGWVCIGVLVATGALNLHLFGYLRTEVLLDRDFWGTAYGTALAWKLSAVGVMIAASAVHDFVLGPAAGRAMPGTPAAARLRRTSAWVARGSAVVGVVLIAAAVRLARGG
jgi:copper resistance protein D